MVVLGLVQNVSLQKSLQTLEGSSKQQFDLSNRTIRELKERMERLSLEGTQKDQQLQNLRKEVDHFVREKQTKVCKRESSSQLPLNKTPNLSGKKLSQQVFLRMSHFKFHIGP